jgi:hypothetical protein
MILHILWSSVINDAGWLDEHSFFWLEIGIAGRPAGQSTDDDAVVACELEEHVLQPEQAPLASSSLLPLEARTDVDYCYYELSHSARSRN